MPALRSTCGCLSLQVGVVTLSAVMTTLSVIIMNLTLLNYKTTNTPQFPLARIIVLIFVAFLLMVATFSFLGAYKESRNLIIISFGLLVLLAVYWLTMCIFSMTDRILHTSNICIQKRCAPSLWIVRFDYSEHDIYAKYNFPFPYTTVSTDKVNDKTDLTHIKQRRMNSEGYLESLPDYTENENNALTAENNYDNIDSTESTLGFKTKPTKGRNNPRTNKPNFKRKSTSPSKNRSNKSWMGRNFSNFHSFQNQRIFRRSPENTITESAVSKSTNDSKKPVYNINTKILEPDHLVEEDDDYYYDDKLDNYGWHLKSGWHLFGLILLFFTNMIFFFFNAINLWSYADELFYKYVGYDDDGEPEEHS